MTIETKKIKLTIDGHPYEMSIPHSFILREQNPECNGQGHICAEMEGNKVCAKILLTKEKNGDVNLMELTACSKNKKGIVMEI